MKRKVGGALSPRWVQGKTKLLQRCFSNICEIKFLNWGMHVHIVQPPSPGYGPNMVHVCVVYDKIKMLSSCKKNRLGRTTCSVYEVDRNQIVWCASMQLYFLRSRYRCSCQRNMILFCLRNEFNSYPSYTSITWVGAVYALNCSNPCYRLNRT